MPHRITIEATDEPDEGGLFPPYSIEHAPTWALERAVDDIRKELDARKRIRMLIKEEERQKERSQRKEPR